jgi:hypothetical protein
MPGNLSGFGQFLFGATLSGVSDPITQFHSKLHRYPGNNKQWWVAKADTDDPDKNVKAGDFTPEILDKFFAGNNQAPKGHYVVNAFYKDRAGVSGVAGIPIEITNERPSTVAFYSGRVWYACNSNVYFSQLLTSRHKAGLCYQDADPTSEDISDLIATDGGVIPIPEATKIIKLLPHGSGVMVFAVNGVWNITGSSGGFTALDISVNKVSPIGCKNPMTVVETEDSVYWWGDTGIMAMQEKVGQYGPIPGAFDRANITENTIQTLYNDIPENAKREAKGVYDARNNCILWLYRDDDVDGKQYNKVLLFDGTLAAFYPWRFSGDTAATPVCKGFLLSERINLSYSVETVVSEGVQVTSNGEDVQVTIENVSRFPSNVEYVTHYNNLGYFSQVYNHKFVDWETHNTIGYTYDSYVETGYELFNDAMRKKNLTYILTYLRRTEGQWYEDGTVDDASSCYMTVKWDWANSGNSNKWTAPVQVYRNNRFVTGEPDGSIDTGFPVVVTKNKVRGNGKSLQFRFGTDERERNFDLHGWSIAVTGNTVP